MRSQNVSRRRVRRSDVSANGPTTSGSLESGLQAAFLKLGPIEYRPIGAIRPNPKNARTHSDRQIAQIAASIARFG
jgi:hypothetical protein